MYVNQLRSLRDKSMEY